MKKSTTGYKQDSKDRNEPYLEIPSNSITMRNVPHKVIAIDDNGKINIMSPNMDYLFKDTNSVVEVPVKQKGGSVKKYQFDYLQNEYVAPTLPQVNIISTNNPDNIKTLGILEQAQNESGKTYYPNWIRSGKPSLQYNPESAFIKYPHYSSSENTIYYPGTNNKQDQKTLKARKKVAEKYTEEELRKNIKEIRKNNPDLGSKDLTDETLIKQIYNANNSMNDDNFGYRISGSNLINAELSHAYQKNVLKKDLIGQGIKDWINDPYISRTGQKRQYNNKSSLEYQAHKIIEPMLTDFSDKDQFVGIDVIRHYPQPYSESKDNINRKREPFQKGGSIMKKNSSIKEFESFLSLLPEDQQDGILDYMDTLDYEDQKKFMQGGKATWSKYQRGGTTNVPVEVEDKETVELPNNELYKFTGKSHAEGGIDTMLPEGSRVFSNYLKVDPKEASALLGRKITKKMSYADLSKKFDTTKWTNILKNKDSDVYQRETAQLQLAHNDMMLDNIFQLQEFNKVKSNKSNKMQVGGTIGTELSPLERLKASYNVQDIALPEVVIRPEQTQPFNWNTLGFGSEGQAPSQRVSNAPVIQVPSNISPNIIDYGNWKSSPDMIVTGQMFTPTFKGKQEKEPEQQIQPKATTILDIQDPGKTSIATGYMVEQKPKSKSKSKPAPVTVPASNRSSFPNFAPLSNSTLPSSVTSSKSKSFNIDDYKVDVEDSYNEPNTKRSNGLGISSKLAGTLLDIGLAASDKLTVNNPQYRDLRKYPLFSRFVDFDDKEVGRNMALNVQQIQNSNLPEEVKQARIADLNSQYKDYQAKIDFGNAQRYEQKLNQDTEKLQNYINANIDQQYQDLERYREKKAKVDFLRDQFNAQKKSRIVNSVRSYLDYVDRTNLENQIYANNYKLNPITGRVDYIGATPDYLKAKERELNQYSQNSTPVQNLPGGAYMTKLPFGQEIIIDAEGKVTLVK